MPPKQKLSKASANKKSPRPVRESPATFHQLSLREYDVITEEIWFIGSNRVRLPDQLFRDLRIKVGDWVLLTCPVKEQNALKNILAKAWPQDPDLLTTIHVDSVIFSISFVDCEESDPNSFIRKIEQPIAPCQQVRLSFKRNGTVLQHCESKYALEQSRPFLKNLCISKDYTLNIPCFNYEIVLTEIFPSSTFVLLNEATTMSVNAIQSVTEEMNLIHTLSNLSLSDRSTLYAVFGQAFVQIYNLMNEYVRFDQTRMNGLPRGILISGPAGVGKSFLVEKTCKELHIPLIAVSCPCMSSPFFGEGEKQLKTHFNNAIAFSQSSNKPCVLLLEDIDVIAHKQTEASTFLSKSLHVLVTLLDSFERDCQEYRVLVVGTTRVPHTIDDIIRRSGRFEREIVVPIPSDSARFTLIEEIMCGIGSSQTIDLQHLVVRTRGYVPADLLSLCQEAAIVALDRHVQSKGIEFIQNEKSSLEMQDFEISLKRVLPSMRQRYDLIIDKEYTWDNLGGLNNLREKLEQAIVWPMKYPSTMRRLNIRPTRGVLLYGPPGCSKTAAAKALATCSNLRFFSASASKGSMGDGLLSPYVGEGEYRLRELFRIARAVGPSLIFFDELESLFPKRDMGDNSSSNGVQERLLTTLLTEMDGICEANRVRFDKDSSDDAFGYAIVLGATNRPDQLDDALLRPGRFDTIIFVGPPDPGARQSIFEHQTKEVANQKDIDFGRLVCESEGYSAADIVNICREALLNSMRKHISTLQSNMEDFHVSTEDFVQALRRIPPSITEDLLQVYERFQLRKCF